MKQAVEMFAFNVRNTNRIWNWLDQVDREEIGRHLDRHEFLPVLKMLEPWVFADGKAGAGVV
jgi:uncharacterized damage-inducible protein DinB